VLPEGSKHCSKCGTTVKLIRTITVIGGRKTVVFLCESCLEKVTIEEQLGNGRTKLTENELRSDSDLFCVKCQRSWSDFLSEGYLGCENCFRVFESLIEEILVAIHGTSENLETRKTGGETLARLSIKLKEAVAKEDFEMAARLRDQIVSMKKDIEK
jgi:protein arginine kinase activator